MTTHGRDEIRPALPYEAWKDTYATLHMWTQIVGKIALRPRRRSITGGAFPSCDRTGFARLLCLRFASVDDGFDFSRSPALGDRLREDARR